MGRGFFLTNARSYSNALILALMTTLLMYVCMCIHFTCACKIHAHALTAPFTHFVPPSATPISTHTGPHLENPIPTPIQWLVHKQNLKLHHHKYTAMPTFLTTHTYTVLILPPQWNKLTTYETISLNS